MKRMKTMLCISVVLFLVMAASSYSSAADRNYVFRIYNPVTGEHLYTSDFNERWVLVFSKQWVDEDMAWISPVLSDDPVYRLFHEETGTHFYTIDEFEKSVLLSCDWKDEGVAWFSTQSDGVPVYRLFNPVLPPLAAHHFTSDEYEKNYLKLHGWRDEGVAWFGMKEAAGVFPIEDNADDSNPSITVSILGDSISAVEGTVPDGYRWYYGVSDSFSANDIWWKQYLEKVNGVLCENNSWSGSLVSGTFPAMSSPQRINDLSSETETPGLILVFAGTNDFLWQIDVDAFSQAYKKMLENIREKYPNAKIECATLTCSSKALDESNKRNEVELYNNAIREAAEELQITVIDLAQYAESIETSNSIHPTKEGQLRIAELWLECEEKTERSSE